MENVDAREMTQQQSVPGAVAEHQGSDANSCGKWLIST